MRTGYKYLILSFVFIMLIVKGGQSQSVYEFQRKAINLEIQKNYTDALNIYSQAIGLLKGNENSELKFELSLGKLRCLKQTTDVKKAIEFAFEMSEIKPSAPSDFVELAIITGELAKPADKCKRAITILLPGLETANKLNKITEQLTLNKMLADCYTDIGKSKKATEYLAAYAELVKKQKDVEIKDKEQSVMRNLERLKAKNEEALAELNQQVELEKKDKEVVAEKLKEKEKTLDSTVIITEVQGEQIRNLEVENKLKQEALTATKQRNNVIIIASAIIFSFLILIVYIIYNSYRNSKRLNKLLSEQKALIEAEQAKSEGLLLNILPVQVASELKINGKAEPKHYEQVSVLFTDFKGFTAASEKLTPNEIIAELDECFGAFDKIVDKYGLEKIKTIGDAYMCASGLPIANDNNAELAVKVAIEMRAFMSQWQAIKKQQGKQVWEIRIGINTGPVVAGVIGSKKFAYDIWGDTVNTASRMESAGEPGKINISENTYLLISDKFNCTYRGKLPIKNKADMAMYFVESEKN